MIDFTYAKNKTYDFTGETILVGTTAGTYTYHALSGEKTYLEHLTSFLAFSSMTSITMDTEFITIVAPANLNYFNISNATLASLLGFESAIVGPLGGVSNTYTLTTWGYKLPRTNVHELASLQGGFVVEKQIKDMYRQRETKVTKNMTYSTNFSVRMGLTYNYRLDKRYLDQFMTILAEWMDEEITHTSDWGIDDGTCISDDSGIRTLVYPDQEIYMVTITLLGAASGTN